jgi:uncharacterized protein (DUF924 family)
VLFTLRAPAVTINESGMTKETILAYWFGKGPFTEIPENSKFWYEPSKEIDEEIRSLFEETLLAADAGNWENSDGSARGRLATLLLFDQFPRHIYRGSVRAYSFDEKARALCHQMLDLNDDQELNFFERSFLYLPLEHSEDLADQEESFFQFRQLALQVPENLKAYFEDNLKYAERHFEIIRRFGRFPHRNEVLKRNTTPEEKEFLKEPLSSF